MREAERMRLRKKLDKEMRPYRRAAKQTDDTELILRAIRQAVAIPVAEIAAKLKVNRSVIFELEKREGEWTVALKSLDRVAAAMGCEVVYGIVPADGKTFEDLAEERRWRKELARRQGISE